MNKVINSKCICGDGLPWKQYEVIMINPCEHLIHRECLKSHQCPYCKINITGIIKKHDYLKNPKLYQKCIDIISMTNFDKLSKINYFGALTNLPNFLGTIIQIPFTKGFENGKKLVENIFNMNNIQIKVNGLEKIKNEPKVFISNHTSHLDFLIIFYILGCGFLASSVIKDNIIAKKFTDIVPLLLIDRGKHTNTVEKMKEYIKEIGSICLFPEGMITNPNTIINFRK